MNLHFWQSRRKILMIFPIHAQAHTLFQLTLPPPPFFPYKDLTKCPRGNEINDSYHLYLGAESHTLNSWRKVSISYPPSHFWMGPTDKTMCVWQRGEQVCFPRRPRTILCTHTGVLGRRRPQSQDNAECQVRLWSGQMGRSVATGPE